MENESISYSEVVSTNTPLVSVIITCYNHSEFLQDAILSIAQQTWPALAIEVLLVDDGSTDSTKEVADTLLKDLENATYIYQENKGLSSARNTGVKNSNGRFILFLDADDWLYPDAIAINLGYFHQHPDAAFVSGGHNRVDQNKRLLEKKSRIITNDHYINLLRGNYIEMHATVLFQRWVFQEFHYDVNLKACEDYECIIKYFKKIRNNTSYTDNSCIQNSCNKYVN